MKNNLLEYDIQYLKGVGEKRAVLLKKELLISTFHDLLYYFPFKYVDRTTFYKIRELNSKLPYVQLCGKITNIQSVGTTHKKRLSATFSDDTGTIEWYGLKAFDG